MMFDHLAKPSPAEGRQSWWVSRSYSATVESSTLRYPGSMRTGSRTTARRQPAYCHGPSLEYSLTETSEHARSMTRLPGLLNGREGFLGSLLGCSLTTTEFLIFYSFSTMRFLHHQEHEVPVSCQVRDAHLSPRRLRLPVESSTRERCGGRDSARHIACNTV